MIKAGIRTGKEYISAPVNTGVVKEVEVKKDKSTSQYKLSDNEIIREQLMDAARVLGERGIQNVFFNNVEFCRQYIKGLQKAMDLPPLAFTNPDIAVRITEDGERWYSANYFTVAGEDVAFPIMLFREPYAKEKFTPKMTMFTMGL